MNKIINTDVVIVGKGIAGLVLSILLNEQGIDFVVLDYIDRRKRIAQPETLPPSTMVLLETLQLRALFEESALKKTFGYHSIWGMNKIVDNNFFFHNPYKYGLKFNKEILLKKLENIVSDKVFRFKDILQVNCAKDNVEIEVEQNNTSLIVQGKIMVDATGRSRAVLKNLNIKTESYDDLMAFSCHLPKIEHPNLVHSTFVESFKNGWGIVSDLDEVTNVMTLFTNKQNPILRQLKKYNNWKNIILDTSILKGFLIKDLNPRIVACNANSSRASRIAGKNWLALGDSAISFDPLSSHGISNAIYSANLASKTITSALKNEQKHPFTSYENTLTNIFETYLKNKSKIYDSEKRWQQEPFWNNNGLMNKRSLTFEAVNEV